MESNGILLQSFELREKFIDFFKKKGHNFVQSSSLVPAGDDSIMFTNAGMVQFKDYFTGTSVPPFPRAVTLQKCMRAGGKHNDLENVGKTSRHHTFFEMLGNFSFGDYFKKDAVFFAYEFLSEALEIDLDRLYVTVHHKDEDGYSIWKNDIGFDEKRIFKLGDDSNFWQMGETGPCGYSSEIFFDTGFSEVGHSDCDITCECGRYLEIWNLVFMEFNRDKKGILSRLPRPSIDTGMGLERMLRVLQNVKSNYDTDVFTPYIKAIDGITGKTYNDGDEGYDIAARVISDHIRTSVFLASESIFPSNEGRGYVYRRILRRLIRYSLKLGLTLENLVELGNTVVIVMGGFYPEVTSGVFAFQKIISEEYERFNDTVGIALKILDEEIADLKRKGETTIPGDYIFKLYDTNGLPVDLVADVAFENNFSLDMKKFSQLMDNQRKASRKKKDKFDIMDFSMDFPRTVFTGYGLLEDEGRILAIMDESGVVLDEINDGDEYFYLVSDKSPFYPEGGGQSGDKGKIAWDGGGMNIFNTIKTKNGLILHYGRVLGRYERKMDNAGIKAVFKVDAGVRNKTAANHSATHLLQSALRSVLGGHIGQQGSYVDSERLRFDFSHSKPLSGKELREVELAVNANVFANISVTVKEMDVKTALDSGALHFFDEKYEDVVRVVSIGDVSREFCGGTHVGMTGNIGFFKITGESSVASGIRRIEAVTGFNYLDRLYIEEDNFNNIASLLDTPRESIYGRIIKLYYDYEYLEKSNKDLKIKINGYESVELIKKFRKKGDISYLVASFTNLNQNELKELVNVLRSRNDFPEGNSIVVFISLQDDEKISYLCMAEGNCDASAVVKSINSKFEGKGGGRRDFAQGGSSSVSKFQDAVKIIEELV